MGPEGESLQQQLVDFAKTHGLRIIGPNCIGIISTHAKLNASFGIPIKNYGNIAFISQSGALADGIFGWAQDKGIGFSIFVSIGNKCDVDEADLVEYLANDDNTRVICLYVEGIMDGRKFIESASRVFDHKPIVVMKGGLTAAGVKAASSHTGSLAGSSQIYDAAFRKAGVLRVNSLEEMMDAARVLSLQSAPRGNRVVIVTDAGGMGIIAADVCEGSGLKVPELPSEMQNEIKKYIPKFGSARNPIDVTGQGTPPEHSSFYENVVRIIQNSDIADILLLCVEGSYPIELMSAVKDVIVQKISPTLKIPTIVSWLGAESLVGKYFDEIERVGRIPIFPTPERGAKACEVLTRYGQYVVAKKLSKTR
jgi:acyl-CoA synthetase (NDP forming)